MVLAVPGGPSSKMCPPANNAVSIRSTVSRCPVIAFATSSLIAVARAFTSSTFTEPPCRPVMQLLCCFMHLSQLPGFARGLEAAAEALSFASVAGIEPAVECFARQALRRAEQCTGTCTHQRRITVAELPDPPGALQKHRRGVDQRPFAEG